MQRNPPPLTPQDRLVGLLLGQALGDALGFVVEAQPPETAARYVREWLGHAPRPHPDFGQYSDDTQLTRELLVSYRDAGGWDPSVFAHRVAALFGEGRVVGGGPGTRAAALRMWKGTPWREAATPAPYAGNGSAMRVAPFGLLLGRDARVLRRAAAEQSYVTHGDPRCAGASIAIAGAVALAARPGLIDRAAFLQELASWVSHEDREVAEVVAGIERWADLSSDAAARHVHAELDPAAGSEWQGISAFVLPSVAWALYAFLRSPDDYWGVVRTAIEPGGDTDTMAAMAGAIAGARLGPATLPGTLLDRLTDRGTWGAAALTELARECASYA